MTLYCLKAWAVWQRKLISVWLSYHIVNMTSKLVGLTQFLKTTFHAGGMYHVEMTKSAIKRLKKKTQKTPQSPEFFNSLS